MSLNEMRRKVCFGRDDRRLRLIDFILFMGINTHNQPIFTLRHTPWAMRNAKAAVVKVHFDRSFHAPMSMSEAEPSSQPPQ